MNVRVAGAGLRALIVPLTVAALLSMFTYALTAGNVVPNTNAGSGATAVAGYTVSAVDYDLNDTNPQNIDVVTFTLSPAPPAAAEIRAKVRSAETVYYTCSVSGAAVSCPSTSPQATASGADQLTVIVG